MKRSRYCEVPPPPRPSRSRVSRRARLAPGVNGRGRGSPAGLSPPLSLFLPPSPRVSPRDDDKRGGVRGGVVPPKPPEPEVEEGLIMRIAGPVKRARSYNAVRPVPSVRVAEEFVEAE